MPANTRKPEQKSAEARRGLFITSAGKIEIDRTFAMKRFK
jgi:hypothetical protein